MLLSLLLGCPSPPDSKTACTLEVTTGAADGAPISLELASAGLLRTRAVGVSDGADVPVHVEGAVEVVDAGGAPLTTVAAPAEVYLRAIKAGSGEVRFGIGRCAVTITTQARAPMLLVGRARTLQPFWQSETSTWSGETVELGLDPTHLPDRVGQPFDAWLVPHQSAEAWAADGSLAGTRVSGTLGETLVPLELGAPDAGGETHTDFDVVVDWDQDGELGPGDQIQGLGSPGLTVLGDLTQSGPHAVDTEDVSGGRWLGERVWWPTDLAALGPRPLVVISHGNGHDYTWYDYLGEHLASWGFVVMAHQNNTEPGIETASTTTITNTDWLLGNLELVGGGALVGLVDSARVGWIGHSRGGEGVVRAYDRVFEGETVPENFSADDVQFIASIAPTVFNNVGDSDPHDRPYFLIAGTADGDVTGGVDNPIVQFFRIWERDTGPKAAAYVQGASHNDFNCCGAEEGQGPSLIGRDEAQVIAKGALLAVARAWLDGDEVLLDSFKNEYTGFTPLGLADTDYIANSWRNAPGAGDGVLDDFQTEPDVDKASSGGAVTTSAGAVVEDRLRDGDATLAYTSDDPMNAMSHNAGPQDDARGTVFEWGEERVPYWSVTVPEALSDTSPWTVLSLSVTERSRHPETDAWGGPLAFGVTLTDLDGVASTVDFADQALVPFPYARLGNGAGRGWANEFVTVRINLADFAVGSEIDLTRIAEVRLEFGPDHGAPVGALGLDSVEFAR